MKIKITLFFCPTVGYMPYKRGSSLLFWQMPCLNQYKRTSPIKVQHFFTQLAHINKSVQILVFLMLTYGDFRFICRLNSLCQFHSPVSLHHWLQIQFPILYKHLPTSFEDQDIFVCSFKHSPISFSFKCIIFHFWEGNHPCLPLVTHCTASKSTQSICSLYYHEIIFFIYPVIQHN